MKELIKLLLRLALCAAVAVGLIFATDSAINKHDISASSWVKPESVVMEGGALKPGRNRRLFCERRFRSTGMTPSLSVKRVTLEDAEKIPATLRGRLVMTLRDIEYCTFDFRLEKDSVAESNYDAGEFIMAHAAKARDLEAEALAAALSISKPDDAPADEIADSAPNIEIGLIGRNDANAKGKVDCDYRMVPVTDADKEKFEKLLAHEFSEGETVQFDFIMDGPIPRIAMIGFSYSRVPHSIIRDTFLEGLSKSLREAFGFNPKS
jgi:hypothetical protein